MKTVIFDLGKVLVDYDWETYLRTFHYEEDIYQRVADAVFRNEDWVQGDIGNVTTEEWLNLFIENAPECEAQIREVFQGFGGTIVPLDYTEAWIRYFRENGYRIYYLSNFSCELYRQSKETLSFIDDFDGGIFSWKEKCIKPDEEIYHRLLNRYSIIPEEALFYDDRPENVEAARKLGINGIVFHKDIPLQMMEK
ncbi:HAD family hydrolase [Bariatricus sp. SGI.154]|uniref:HAD family hydrolase n=1 Tax=Bariatricus sp. SGI.154 TaxID=3420549 RepID=UPI003D082486